MLPGKDIARGYNAPPSAKSLLSLFSLFHPSATPSLVSKMSFQHQDAFGRTKEVAAADSDREYYLRPIDGRLKPLQVHGFTHSNQSDEPCTWARTGEPQECVPTVIKIVHWTFS